MLKINRRLATPQDWLKMKKHTPYSTYRNVAKSENFGLMFGAKPSTFRKILQGSDFSTEDCKDFLKLTKTENVYNEIVLKSKDNKFNDIMRPEVECLYLAVATVMRENFFKGYKGLADRITREHLFAIKHFYSRNWYGAIRWHPELAYMNIDPITLQLKGVDKKYSSLIFNHLMNNSANTTIQSGETTPVYCSWINTTDYLKKYKFKSRIFNSIHDSLDVYVYKPEKEVVKSLINENAAWLRYPYEGIPQRMEPEVSDIRDYEYLQKHYYKHGEEEKVQPIKEALQDFNKKYKYFGQKELTWDGCKI